MHRLHRCGSSSMEKRCLTTPQWEQSRQEPLRDGIERTCGFKGISISSSRRIYCDSSRSGTLLVTATHPSRKLFALPENTRVYPGHDYNGRLSSTIGEEKRWNERPNLSNPLAVAATTTDDTLVTYHGFKSPTGKDAQT